ncbi:hypothetical protein N7481_006594 [Penicillium waksmanii]|uniref:uncharacterized protein n=1 Tax=Penicillium waksmanii TaxID=69791 RepID=UPI0025480B6B|nr:uncharacterized protein N7481_006594 [Penicillium waksmanii]KAJ5984495.1 hypothetical protein N7481_006594 [Penicillium waksmanii]
MEDSVENPSDVSKNTSIDSLESTGLSRPAVADIDDGIPEQGETLDARSEYTTSQDDGTAEHRINQYIIRQEIGRGSFGAVHLAADQFGNEYAVKEFSKSRLRKRAQSHLLRRPRGPRRPGTGFNSPLHRHPSEDDNENAKNPLYLIKEEIAIMKKLNHNNLVSLIEVLDDPTEDSLYMVMEMCKKGVVMKVGLEERADPYDDEHCRCWFRDLMLGIEYLHAQGIVHRDIKPDNCLVTSDDVLKVVDFGVSEMFAKESDMFTAKSAGSPAFLPPELCVVKHGDVSGKAADIWSMGVTLYCLRYGRLPFEQQSIFELYESIRSDEVVCEDEQDEQFKDLMARLLEKDPAKRIRMRDLRTHPWVTLNGTNPLLSKEENTAQMIEPPTEEEMNMAITGNFGRLMTVMKAVKNFKRLVDPAKGGAGPTMQSILGGDAQFVAPPMEMDESEDFPEVGLGQGHGSHGLNAGVRRFLGRSPMSALRRDHSGPKPWASDSASMSSRPEYSPASSRLPSGVFEQERRESGSIRSGRSGRADERSQSPKFPLSRASSATTKRSIEGTRGHARDPLEENWSYLSIGPSTYTGTSQTKEFSVSDPVPIFAEPDSTEDIDLPAVDDPVIVSESPGAADFDIYETAYGKELERIRSETTQPSAGAGAGSGTDEGAVAGPKVYLTRRVEGRDEVMKFVKDKTLNLQVGQKFSSPIRGPSTAFGAAASMLRNQIQQQKEQAGREEQRQASEHNQAHQQERRGSHPYSSASIPEPEPSALEATGTHTDAPAGESTVKLRRLLNRARDKSGE